MRSLHQTLTVLAICGLACLLVGACDSADGGDNSPAVDVSKVTCGAGTLAVYDECVAYGECYGKMCSDQSEGAALEACVGTGGEAALSIQLGPACNSGDETAIRAACDAGTAQLIAGGTQCTPPGGAETDVTTETDAAGDDVSGSQDVTTVDPSSREGPCENHMEGECLGTDYGYRCETVNDEFGQSSLQWVLTNCVEGDYATMCRNDLNGTPMCKPSQDGTSAACECEM